MKSTKLPSWIERLLGLDPVPAPPHVFAIDQETLRYGCFHGSPQGFVYETGRSESLPDGLFQGGPLGGAMREPRVFWELLDRFVKTLPGPIKEASLILPDSWLRIAFTESEPLPAKAKARDEILRFKLKRLVPFRVEDLRLQAAEVTPFPEQQDELRLLLGFAIENLVAQLEDAFTGVGITLGRITNTTLALLSSLEKNVAPGELAALVAARSEAYTVSYLYDGEPLLYRYKAFGDEPPYAVDGGAVRRDLRLTDSFLRQQFPDRPLRRLFLASPEESEGEWLDWLRDELEVEPEPLSFEHFPLARTQAGESWLVTAPLLGAAGLEVA